MSGLCAWTLVPSELGELIPGGDLAADCVEGGLPFATDVTDLDWSPDGTLLAASGGVAKRFIVWDAASGEVVHASETFPQFPISSIQFSARLFSLTMIRMGTPS